MKLNGLRNRRPRTPDCHPDRKHRALGLCEECWFRQYREKKKDDPKWREKQRHRYTRWNNKPETKIKKRNSRIKKTYGITPERFSEMLKEQDGVCRICRMPMNPKICIDHDHVTGKVRGLLCHNCNVGLGNFGHLITILLEAAKYLQSHSPECELDIEREFISK